MIIVRAPYRISFLGGSTDYLPWLENNPGLVVGTTINQYSTIVVRRNPSFFKYLSKFSYSEVEEVNHHSEIQHKVIEAVIRQFDFDFGIELTHLADLPSKTGIGSSSTFLVAIIYAMACLKKIALFRPEIFELAVHIEQNILKENVGLQDSAWATFGGFNAIEFGQKPFETQVRSINNHAAIAQLEKDLLFLYSGIERSSHDVAKVYTEKKVTSNQAAIYQMALEGLGLLEDGDIYGFGDLMNKSWEQKRGICTSISNDIIDDAYNKSISLGAYGFKLCGAGAGGCIAVLAPKERHAKILDALRDFKEIPIQFENNGVHKIYG